MTERLLFLGSGLLIFGLLLLFWALKIRKRRGLGSGTTIFLDDLVLYSEALKILSRPDRIVRQGGNYIPEEWKPTAKRVYQSHRLQVAGYCLLIEERFSVKPPYGVVVIQGGRRVEVPFTDELRAHSSVNRGQN